MRKTTLVTAACLLLAATIAHGSTRVANIELSNQDGFSVARIDVEGTIRFTHQTEVAKDGRPFRVIVDILTAVHHLGAKEFLSLPNCAVQTIRTSQYSIKPEKITRIVFDMEKETTYRVESNKNSVSIFFPDKSRQPFKTWSTSALLTAQAKAKMKVVSTEPPPKPAAAPVKQTSRKVVRELTSTELNAVIAKDRQESLRSTAAPAAKTPAPLAVKTATPVAVKAVTPAPKKTTKDTDHKTPKPAKSPGLFSDKDKFAGLYDPPAVKAKPVKQASVKTQNDTKVSSAGKMADAQPTVVPEKPKTAPAKTVTKPAPAVKSKDTKAKTALAAIDKNESVKSPTKSASQAVKKPASKTKPKAAVKASPKPVASGQLAATPVKNQKVTKTVSDSPTPSKAKVDKALKPTKPAVKPTPEADKAKSKPDKKSTSRFRRSPTMSKKIKGTLVAEFPKRLVVKYKTKSYRDPFGALINDSRTYSDPIEKRVPSVEGLKLVGVLESGSGANSALFEGTDGYGYILKTGDRVQKGYVLRVESDRVFFQLFEYGWSRTMALNIED